MDTPAIQPPPGAIPGSQPIQLSPQEQAQADAQSAPALTPPPGAIPGSQPIDLSPQEKAQADAQSQRIDPMREFTPQQLADLSVQDPDFSIPGQIAEHPEYETNPEIRLNAARALNILKQKSFSESLPGTGFLEKTKNLSASALKTAGLVSPNANASLFGAVSGAVQQQRDIAMAGLAPFIEAGAEALGRHDIAQAVDTWQAQHKPGGFIGGAVNQAISLAQMAGTPFLEELPARLGQQDLAQNIENQRQRQIGEENVATESAATGALNALSRLSEAGGRISGKLKPFSDYTDAEKLYDLQNDVEALKQEKLITAGKGATADIRTASAAAQLAAQKTPIRPEQVASLAQADPATTFLMSQGFNAPEGLLKTVSPELFDLGRQALDVMGNRTAQATGRTISGLATGAKTVAKGVEKTAPAIGSAGGAIYGLSKLPEGGATGTFAALAGGKALGEGVSKTAATLQPILNRIAGIGEQISGKAPMVSPYAQIARSALQAAPAVAADVAKGAAFDAAMAGTAETPQDLQGLGMGTLFGGLVGAKEAGGRVLGDMLANPRSFYAGPLDPAVSSTGNFPALDALHQDAMANAPTGVQNRLNAVRSFLKGVAPGSDIFLGDSANPEKTSEALQSYGVDKRTADFVVQQNGWTPTSLPDANGVKRNVILAMGADSAPHEVRHVIQKVLGAENMQAIDAATRAAYSDDEWEKIGQNYADDLNQGASPEVKAQPWRQQLSKASGWSDPDKYLAREIDAEHFDTVFNNRGAGIAPGTLPDKIASIVGRVVTALGGNPVAGKTSAVGKVPLQGKLLEQAAATTPKPAKAPEPLVTPKPATTSPLAGKKSTPAVPVTPEQQQNAAAEARSIADAAPDVMNNAGTKSQREILGTAAEAIANRQGMKIDYESAPGTPAGSPEAPWALRRAQIETGRTFPPSERPLWEKNFTPERVKQIKNNRHQIYGWTPEGFAANAHELASFIADNPSMKSQLPVGYEIDPETQTFTPDTWRRLYTDTGRVVQNHMAGRTGSGVPLEMPALLRQHEFYLPPLREGGGPVDQYTSDFINHLFGVKLPEGNRMTEGKMPQNVAGQLVSRKTIPGRVSKPVTPRGTYAKAPAEGIEISEVNPVRKALENAAAKLGKKLPQPKSALQNLNVERIKNAVIAPEQPQFRGNTLALESGFEPKPREPRAIKAAAVRDEQSGKTYEGVMHWMATQKMLNQDFGGNSTVLVNPANGGRFTDGFTDNAGNFLTREQAADRAVELGQIDPQNLRDRLGSELELGGSLESKLFQQNRQYQPAPKPLTPEVENLIDNAHKMTVDEWSQHIASKGGLTQHAYNVGAKAKTQADLDALRAARAALDPARKAAMQAKDWNTALSIGSKGQALGEAYEAATGKTLEGLDKSNVFPAEHQFPMAPAEGQAQPKTYVVRHGSTEMNDTDPAKDRIRGHINVPLSEKGRTEAQETAAQLADSGIKTIYSSDLDRTMDTAKAIADKTGATIVPDAGLRPWNFGPTIEGKPTADMLPKIKRLVDNPDERPPGGETFNEFKDRFLQSFHAAQDASPDENSAIVTHYRGTKLLQAWRKAGVTNDAIDRQVFDEHANVRQPGSFDVIDKTGAEIQPQTSPEGGEFAPRKREKVKPIPREFWISKNGKLLPAPEGHYEGAFRHDLIPEGWKNPEPQDQMSGVYEYVLGKGHLRGRTDSYGDPGVTMTHLHGNEKNIENLPPAQRRVIEDIALNSEHPTFYNGQRIGGPPGNLGGEYAPRNKDWELKPAGTPLSSADLSNMTRADIAAHYPEAVIPRRRDESIPSEITKSPLYLEATGGHDTEAARRDAVQAFSRKLVEAANQYKDTPEFRSGLRWYSEFVPKLKEVFGDDAPIMAELLAATSPRTPPEVNYKFALDALESYKTGKWDKMIDKYGEGLKKVNDDTWRAWYDREVKNGNVKKAPKEPSAASFLAHWVDKYGLEPKQSNGKLYGMHSASVLKVLARKWFENAGLKTTQFVKNLLGLDDGATIDVWADRTMRRLGYSGSKERWRILPQNRKEVSGEDFHFSQEAFADAAAQLGLKPSALQGGLWFAEKKHWADNGWSRLDLGDFREEIEKTPRLREEIQQRLAAGHKSAKVKSTAAPSLAPLLRL